MVSCEGLDVSNHDQIGGGAGDEPGGSEGYDQQYGLPSRPYF